MISRTAQTLCVMVSPLAVIGAREAMALTPIDRGELSPDIGIVLDGQTVHDEDLIGSWSERGQHLGHLSKA